MNTANIVKIGFFSAALAAMIVTAGCKQGAKSDAAASDAEVALDTTEKKVTYIVGYNMAQQAKTNGVAFDVNVMSQAIRDVQSDADPRIAQEEQQTIMMAFQEEQQKKREAENAKVAGESMAKAKAFLEENAKKDGIVTTESGLQYEIISEGPADGASPKAEDTVKVHYHGTLTDGDVFDSSVDRGEPVSFPVNGVIQGWVEGLQLMSVGDKYKFYIPPELGYGERGTPGKIGPNAALVFDVELLEINPKIEAHGDMGAEGHEGHNH